MARGSAANVANVADAAGAKFEQGDRMMSGTGRVEGMIAMVTGGASGIGRACAQRLAEQGARVRILDRNVEDGAMAAEALGAGVSFAALDVRDEAAWRETIAAVVANHGGLNILVNAAGIYMRGPEHNPETATLADWRTIHGVNMEGVFLGCKHAIPAMRDSGGGSIVNISSVAGLRASAHAAAYGASKGGVRQFSKSVAHHCARRGYGIRCNSIHPGSIDTPMGQHAMLGVAATVEEGRERYRKAIPLKAIGEPDDIAYAVLYLASDEAKYVTGQELAVDGGVMMA
jgi:3(or 17)beta-hydroxysteroid dehydrogenase